MKSFAGSLLIARTILKDGFFAQTVILLLQHSEEGAFGVVLNRPAEVDDLPFPLFIGGPCKFQGLIMVHGHADWVSEEDRQEVCPGVFLGTAECVSRVSEADDAEKETYQFRVFSGYSGWGPDQLEREMSEGSWAVIKSKGQEIFGTPAEELWPTLVPPAIPQPSRN
jgi:putative transcriptional regulator